MHRICLVGAGGVSQIHADAIRGVPGAELTAVCDTDAARAEALAEGNGLQSAFSSIGEAVGSDSFDSAHVLVPPTLHVAVARELLDAGIRILVEKPLGVSTDECAELARHAKDANAALGVNHNTLFYPAYLELRDALASRALGRLHHVALIRTFPPEALPPRGHWIYQQPQNFLYESGAHFLAQLYDLAGPVVSASTVASGRQDLGPDRFFYDTWQVSLVCERATAQLFLSFGGSFATWQLAALCEDGMAIADIEGNRLAVLDKTRWPAYVEPLHRARTLASGEVRQGLVNFGRGALSLLGISAEADLYSLSMRESMAAFHNGAADGRPTVDADFGTGVVAMCEAATQEVATDAPPAAPPRRPQPSGACDAVVIGGTGFIGRSLVEQMLAQGLVVRVMARTTTGLPDTFEVPAVQLFEGNIADPDAVSAAVDGARTVVHLTHGGAFDWEDLDELAFRPAAQVAEASLRSGVERLVYAGSTASLYLGDPNETITGQTPNDPRIREQGAYGFGKARSEEILTGYLRDDGLPLCIVRPAIVLGAGGRPMHAGFGAWKKGIHCIGWNQGTNPLALVLASDVAAAIILALNSEVAVGKTYNLVGDVRLSARRCVEELRLALERPLVFHPRYLAQHRALEISKWSVKRLIGRSEPFPTGRYVKSMGFLSPFDCSDVKNDLGWTPVADNAEFVERGLHVYGN